MNRLLLPLLLSLSGVAFASDPLMSMDDEGSDDGGERDGEDPLGEPGASDKGQSNNIVGGDVVEDTGFQEVVLVSIDGADGDGTCTGSLIHPRWVLTAAHCFDEDTEGVEIMVGNERNDGPIYTAERWVVHPRYKDTNLSTGNEGDIAVILLEEPVNDVFVMALNPDAIDNSWLETDVTFIGFGKTASGRSDTGVKRMGTVPIVLTPEVNTEEPWSFGTYDGNQAVCQGDSGGPGIVDTSKGYVQVGITSYGQVPCGSGRDFAMRVDYYLDWIQQRLAEEGHEALTSPGAPPDFVCSRETEPGMRNSIAIGVVPFDLRCEVDYASPEDLTAVSWQWGDGSTDTTMRGEHTYNEAGNHTIRMCASGTREGGEDWTSCRTRNSMVRACDVPDVEFGAEEVDGLLWQLNNQTDVSTYGCISDLEWEVYQGGELLDSFAGWSPEYEFPEPGEYRVVLNVGGIAGDAAAELDLKVKRRIAGSCSSLGGATGLGLFGLLAGLALVARRRRT